MSAANVVKNLNNKHTKAKNMKEEGNFRQLLERASPFLYVRKVVTLQRGVIGQEI